MHTTPIPVLSKRIISQDATQTLTTATRPGQMEDFLNFSDVFFNGTSASSIAVTQKEEHPPKDAEGREKLDIDQEEHCDTVLDNLPVEVPSNSTELASGDPLITADRFALTATSDRHDQTLRHLLSTDELARTHRTTDGPQTTQANAKRVASTDQTGAAAFVNWETNQGALPLVPELASRHPTDPKIATQPRPTANTSDMQTRHQSRNSSNIDLEHRHWADIARHEVSCTNRQRNRRSKRPFNFAARTDIKVHI